MTPPTDIALFVCLGLSAASFLATIVLRWRWKRWRLQAAREHRREFGVPLGLWPEVEEKLDREEQQNR